MAVSVLDLFKIGVGPSSSHTVGPMRAARHFAQHLDHAGLLSQVERIEVRLLGSLGATGRGHGSDRAVLLGLMGHEPDTVPVDSMGPWVQAVHDTHRLSLLGRHTVGFDPARDLLFQGRQRLPFHPNALTLSAHAHAHAHTNAHAAPLCTQTWYSVGGGFVVSDDAVQDASSGAGARARAQGLAPAIDVLPLPFHSAAELLALTRTHGIDIAEVMRRNEAHWRPNAETEAGLDRIWQAMQDCVSRGCQQEGELPGGFHVQRRAPALLQHLTSRDHAHDPLVQMDWVTLFALAVNEENAAGARVVTAPTNGAAGIVPAVLHHAVRHLGCDRRGVHDFLLTAAAIGLLYKENASISGAEVGCQGEVGVACSMAAAGLCAFMGGRPEQVENAAEIGMEHHLGLTCDPVGGLVQIPCIERNAVGASQALHAARLALVGDGRHRVSLDQVILTMKQTGADMRSHYKETSRGGLAVNIVAC